MPRPKAGNLQVPAGDLHSVARAARASPTLTSKSFDLQRIHIDEEEGEVCVNQTSRWAEHPVFCAREELEKASSGECLFLNVSAAVPTGSIKDHGSLGRNLSHEGSDGRSPSKDASGHSPKAIMFCPREDSSSVASFVMQVSPEQPSPRSSELHSMQHSSDRIGSKGSDICRTTSPNFGTQAFLAEGQGTSALPEAARNWLLQWEARQATRLRQHEENTKQLVETLKRDLMQRLALERKRGALPGSASSLFASFQHEVHMIKSQTISRERSGERDAMRFMPSATPPRPVGGNLESPALTPATMSSRRLRASKPENPVRSFIFYLVHSRAFTLLTSLNVALYTIAVGLIADTEMRSAMNRQEVPDWLWYVDLFFSVSFSIEVALRIVSDGRCYILGSGWKWNIFDVVVAAMGLVDVCLATELNLGFLRVCRACRAIRVLRVLRTFPVLRELRVMAESICCCVPSLAWAVVLLGSVQYIFAVVLLRGASESVRYGSVSQASLKVLTADFGSLSSSIFSLTQAVSGGRSWGELAEPFLQVNPLYGACFPLFVVFVIFGAVNILTGIFVESTAAMINYDKELAVEEELSKAGNVINQIRDFFEELDHDGSGTLSMAELEKSLSDQRVKAYFAVLQIDVSDTGSLFQLLDKDGNGDVSIEEFIEKCLMLRGAAKAMDVQAMMRENNTTRRQMKVLLRSLEDRLDEVHARLPSKEAQRRTVQSRRGSMDSGTGTVFSAKSSLPPASGP